MPKCKKVAKSIMEKWQKENPNNRPSEGENMGAKPSIKSHPSDLSDKVQGDLSDKVKTGQQKDKVQSLKIDVLNHDNFDQLYKHVSSKVSATEINPSMPVMTKCVQAYVKNNEHLKASSISLPDCRYLSVQIRDRMLEEGIIKNNPNYKNGLPKYLVA